MLSNEHPECREGSQSGDQHSGGFIRPLLDKDPPLSSHDVAGRPLMWEPPHSGSSMSSTPVTLENFFQLMTIALQSNENKKQKTKQNKTKNPALPFT